LILRNFAVGDKVVGDFEWASVTDVPAVGLNKIPAGVPAETSLSIIGITGLTAYFGLFEVGKLQDKPAGSTVLVSGAAGATGNVVGQLAKLKGYRVVGIAGSDEKTAWLKDELGFDAVINYKTAGNLFEAIKAACPNGIDLYFDNVGGETFDYALRLLNRFGVVVNCGAISTYNVTEPPVGPRSEWLIITKSLRLQGFIVLDYVDKLAEASKQLLEWLAEGKIQQKVTLYESTGDVFGIARAFIKMLSGDNIGKSVVKIK
jgi:NADPH:quinone reductase